MNAGPVSRPGADGSGRSEAVVSGFVAFLGVVMAFGIEALLPALDLIDDEFDFAGRGWRVSLVVTVMLAGMGCGQVLWGPLSDSVGRVPALCAGLVAFMLGAFGTALATGPVALLAARFVWGIGAAAPNGLRLAVARDCVEGEALARVITLGTAVFLIAPVVMPVFGEAVLLAGPWEAIPLLAVLLAAAAVAVAVWFGETLPRGERVGFGLGPLGRAVAVIARTPASVGAILATVAFSGSFFVFLGSAQPIVDEVFGRDSEFVLFFALNGIAMAVALVVANRSVGRFGRARLAMAAAVLGVLASCAGCIVSVAADGVPPVWVWLAFACAQNAAMAVVTALAAALALQPLGSVAGTGASVLAFGQLAVGGVLAGVVSSFMSSSVTPMFAGAVVYGVAGTVALAWSVRSAGPVPLGDAVPQP